MPRRLLGFLRMIRLRRTWNVISGVRLELTGPCKVGGSFGKRGGVGSARRPKPQTRLRGKTLGPQTRRTTSHDVLDSSTLRGETTLTSQSTRDSNRRTSLRSVRHSVTSRLHSHITKKSRQDPVALAQEIEEVQLPVDCSWA